MNFRTGLRWGLVAMLFYAAVRGSAAAWAPYDETLKGESIGWAARCGGQLLDAPGYRLLDAAAGGAWALNHRDAAALAVAGMWLGLLFALGFAAGSLRGGGAVEGCRFPLERAEARFGRSLALIALAAALAGVAAYGFVTGFLAVVVGLEARKYLAGGTRGRGWATLAVALGTLEALVWLGRLVTAWHPTAL